MIDVCVDSVEELRQWRRFETLPFGRRGSRWSTVVEVTLRGSEHRENHDRGRVRRIFRRRPEYVDLNIELFVAAPGVVDAPAWFTSPVYGLRRLELAEWDLREVDRWVRGLVPTGPMRGEDLRPALVRHFWIDDPSEDRWVDEPHE
jgi:hypothetical protein